MIELHQQFIDRLALQYGEWKKSSSLFGTRSYGDIAELLCISPSQFSKLISGTATDGMYVRSLRNLEQLEELKQLRLAHDPRNLVNAPEPSGGPPFRSWFLLAAGVLVLCGITFFVGTVASVKMGANITKAQDAFALGRFFDREFNSPHASPYLGTMEALDYCPCSAYEGKWELEKQYVIPIPAKKPGLYYIARDSDLRMKCLRSQDSTQGYSMVGFEQMTHELWIDTENNPLSPTYFNQENKSFTKEFFNLTFEDNAQFQKVATISAFMLNRFELEGDKVFRRAEPVGRYAEEVDEQLANDYEIDIKYVLGNVIGNMSKTICSVGQNDHCNPNTLVEGESSLRFDCDFTINTENLGFGGSYPYTKGFRLVSQNYSDNLLCTCED